MSGGGKSGGDAVVGYRYFFGIHMGIGRGPVDEIVAAKVGDSMAWQGSVTASGTHSINMPDLFGGEKKEGGIVGPFTVMMGEPDQDVTTGPVSAILTPGFIPGFRRMVTIYYDGLISAMNPYPKKWSWRVRRAVKGWDGPVMRPDLAVIQLGSVAPPPPIPSPDPSNPWGGVRPYEPPVYDEGVAGNMDEEEESLLSGVYRRYWRSLPAPRPLYDFEGYLTSLGKVRSRPAEDPDEYASRKAAYDLWYRRRAGGQFNSAGTTQVPAEALKSNGQIMAMNPAHIILECLTNREWGRGLDRATLNLGSFELCAQQLFNEGFGLCLRWNRKDSIDNFIQNILDHIAAAIYPERDTALLTLTLVRGDYMKSELPLFTTSNGILSIVESASSTSSGAINEIQVKYRDPVTNEDRIVKAQNLAAIQSAGGAINSTSKEYRGIPTGDLARRVAQRDLRSNVQGIRRFKIVMDRRGWKIRPGGVFRIEDSPRLIGDMVLRAAHIEDGTLLDGKITITAVQDVFSLPSTTFTASEPPRWQPQNNNACVGRHEVFEAPYFILARVLTSTEFAEVTDTSAYVGVVAERGQPSNVSYDLAVRMGHPDGTDWPVDGAYCGYTPPEP